MTRLSVIVLFVALQCAAVQAQEGTPLENDPSRSELFGLLRDYLGDQAPPAEKQLYAFPPGFRFPHDTRWRDPSSEKDPRVNQIFGIDVSHHNAEACHCVLDWNRLADQGVAFAYLKASQGTGSYDKYFDFYRTAARSLPSPKTIYVGPYHFLSSSSAGYDQATYFLKVTEGKREVDDLPPVLDLEWDVRVGPDRKVILGTNGKPRDFWDTVAPEDILDNALQWLDAVSAHTKRLPMIYTNRVWWRQRIGDEALIRRLAKYPIWIADYSKQGRATETPSVVNDSTWVAWQFTASARFLQGGIGTGREVDGNVFSGTMQDFRHKMGLE